MCTTPSEQKTTVQSQRSVCRLRSSPLVWYPSLILIQPRTLKFNLHKGTIVGGPGHRSWPLPWRGISQRFFLERWAYIPWLNFLRLLFSLLQLAVPSSATIWGSIFRSYRHVWSLLCNFSLAPDNPSWHFFPLLASEPLLSPKFPLWLLFLLSLFWTHT